jgi:1-acyl-sn-glycerol-3-phosphate acyltransferase
MQRNAWCALRLFAWCVVRRDLRLDVTGREHVPAVGPAIFASRHVHHLYDGCVLLFAIQRPLHLLVANDWAGRGLRRSLLTSACVLAGWPSISRAQTANGGSSGAPARRRDLRAALSLAAIVLGRGDALGIFPEAYPVFDPRPSPREPGAALLHFARGAADLAWHARRRFERAVPIIPVGLAYQRPRQRGRSQRWQVSLRFGPPLTVDTGQSREEVTRLLEQRVATLSGLPRADLASDDRIWGSP